MIVINNKFEIIQSYNKRKLVPFGEFLPLENFLKEFGFKKITEGHGSYLKGLEDKNILIDLLNILPMICYEVIFTELVQKSDENTNLIINISEDGWFGMSVGIDQHFYHSVFRSIEEGKNIIRSANNGISAYIDSKGQIIKKIESTQKGVIEIDTYKKGSKTIFSSFGNKIFFYFLIFYITVIFLLKKRERQ